MKKTSSYEGLQEEVRKLKMPPIETWKNVYRDRGYTVTMHTPEFTCICPKTGLPDFAELTVEYIPDGACIELKSFKEYLVRFRDTGIFHENAVNRILDDLVTACRPRWMKVTGTFNVRGGIKTTVSSEHNQHQGRSQIDK